MHHEAASSCKVGMTFQLPLARVVCSRVPSLAVDPEAADPFDPADGTRDDFSSPSFFFFFFKHAVIPQPPSSYHPGVREGPGHVSSGQAEQLVMHMSPHPHPLPPRRHCEQEGGRGAFKKQEGQCCWSVPWPRAVEDEGLTRVPSAVCVTVRTVVERFKETSMAGLFDSEEYLRVSRAWQTKSIFSKEGV